MMTWVWELLYLSQMIVISIALGLWAASLERWIPTSRKTRFLIGFCSTPFIIGLWVLLIATISKRGNQFLFTLPLLFFSISIFWRERIRLGKLFTKWRIIFNSSFLKSISFNSIIVWICALIVVGYAAIFMFNNSRQVIAGYDSLGYGSKALYLINHSPISILEEGDGAFRNDDHGLTFPAFLSHAMVMTSGEIGYPNDQTVRDAFQLSIFYMLIAILAVGIELGVPNIGLFAIVILFLVPEMDYISYANSRDAYRIIPLLLLIATLISMSPKKLSGHLDKRYLVAPVVLSFFGFEGHSLGGIIVIFIGMAWLVWQLLASKSISLNMIFVLIALGIGLFFGGIRYLVLYINTGSPFNPTSIEWREGTPLDTSPLQQLSDAQTHYYDSQNALQLLGRDRYLVALPAILGSVAIVLVGIFLRKKIRSSPIMFLSLVVLINLLLFQGWVDIPLISIGRLLRNERYTLHFYPFASLLIAAVIFLIFDYIFKQSGLKADKNVRNIFIVLILLVTAGSIATLNSRWSVPFDSKSWSELVITPLIDANKLLANGSHLLIEDMRYNYYLKNSARVLFTRQTWPLFKATSTDQVKEVLGELNISAIALTKNRIVGWWDQIPLYDYLESNEAILAYENDYYRIYIIKKSISDREQFLAACLQGYGCSISINDAALLAAKIQPEELQGAVDFIQEGQWDQAAEIYERYLKINQPGSSFYLVLAEIYRNQGRVEDMLNSYRKALELLQDKTLIENYVSQILKIQVTNVAAYIYHGMEYQNTETSGTYYNFIDHLAIASMSSSDNSSLLRQTVFNINQQPVGVLFQHPPSQVSFDLVIPAHAWIQYSPVIAPDVWQFGKGDGVQFKIELETQDTTRYLLYDEYLDPKNVVSQRKLITKSISLAYWSGQPVKMIFTTGCGPNNDCRFDWAGWGEPRILQPVAYDFLDHFTETVTDTLGTETGQTKIITESINYEERPILFQHPSSRVVYTMDLPSKATIQFGLGMSPEVWEKSDGVEYNLYVRSLTDPNTLFRVFHRVVDPKNNPDDRQWLDERVDLSRFGGQKVELIFEALPGPANNFDFDWGGWSNPVLIDETLPGSMGVNVPDLIHTSP